MINKKLEEFDEEFNRQGYIDHACTNYVVQENSDKIKSFIKTALLE